MAVVFRAASQASEGNSPNVSGTPPAGTAAGDLLLAVHISDFDGSLSAMTTPSGWSVVGSRNTSTGREPYVRIYQKTAAASEPGSYTFVDSGGANASVGIIRVDGHDPSATLTPTFSSGSSSTSHVAPSVTGVAGGLLITVHCADTGGTSRDYTGAPPGMTERVDTTNSSGGWVVLGMFTQDLAAAGATGAKTATCSVSVRYVTASLVVQPAGTSPRRLFLPF